ncbi:MAG: CDP-alcohol phosphatidyltransferase family protein [Actinobacteria bacterium]|nr:CDP-alcohol phosphatidyltransferase family protein [Actinomycetota bacterium]
MARQERPSVGQNLAVLRSAQKPGGGVPAYMRWINRPIGKALAAVAATLGLTPNAVTLLSFCSSMLGLAIMVVAGPSWGSGLAAAACLALGFALDSADGQLARLTGSGGPAGEWLDHVVDAIRQPVIHLSIAATVLLHLPQSPWLAVVAAVFAVVSSGQFLSQILAEQLMRARGAAKPEPSNRMKSLLLLPTDTGVLCWAFVLWGAPQLFAWVYTGLVLMNAVHAAVSMRRKWGMLREPLSAAVASSDPAAAAPHSPETGSRAFPRAA